MTRPPMTPAEVVEALCEAVENVTANRFGRGGLIHADIARRDRIKAAMVEVLGLCLPPVDREVEELWRKLEEACRGR